MQIFKKIFILIIACSNLSAQTNIFNKDNYGEYTLSNGMSVFVLENTSSATINIEYCVKAGLNSQNKKDSGFFPLYTRLFNYAYDKPLSSLESYCGSDTSSYRITIAPQSLKDTFASLAAKAFSPTFKDEDLKRELEALKEEAQDNLDNPAHVINASIDSRVFQEEPWKEDNYMFPSLFMNNTLEEKRNTLSKISSYWYTPQNSALFVTGCIKKEAVLAIANKTWGQYKPSVNSYKMSQAKAGNAVHKYVIHHKQFSKEMTQIVMQYTSFDMTSSDIASATFNQDNSSLKKLLLKQRNLNIRGNEYINIDSAHKNGISRIIIQSLLEEPQNKVVQVYEQADLFLSKCKEGIKATKAPEYDKSKSGLIKDLLQTTGEAESFMHYLTKFWAMDSINNSDIFQEETTLSEKMVKTLSLINDKNTENFADLFNQETPFIFVLVNDSVYEKYKTDFQKRGYEEISVKNSWFYKARTETEEMSDEKTQEIYDLNSRLSLEDFIDESLKMLESHKLKNGIDVFLRRSDATNNALIMIKIDGGRFNGRVRGVEELFTTCLTNNIQARINLYKEKEILDSSPVVLSEVFPFYSTVSVECTKEDAKLVIRCIREALLFDDISPSQADGGVYEVSQQKRLFNANIVNQMTFRAIKNIYADSKYLETFDTDKEILADVNYNSIMEIYPSKLDASLYTIILTGNINYDTVCDEINNAFGVLSNHQGKIIEETHSLNKDLKSNLKVEVKHLFYTDVKSENAPRRPDILVPTKEFNDPIQYWFKAPDKDKNRLVFNSILYYMKDIFTEEGGKSVILKKATPELPYAYFTFLNEAHTKVMDTYFEEVIASLEERLSDRKEIQKIKNSWVLNELKDTKNLRGTAILIAEGKKEGSKYIDDYTDILNTSQDSYKEASKIVCKSLLFKVYSKDSKE